MLRLIVACEFHYKLESEAWIASRGPMKMMFLLLILALSSRISARADFSP